MSSLRPYQQRVVADVRAALASSGRSGIIMMPTGAGKTKTSVHGLCRPWLQASTANRLYWLVERKALVGQAADDLEQAGARVGLLWAGASPLTGHENALVASVQTLEARPDMRAMFEAALTDRRTLVVADEVHALLPRKSMLSWTADTGSSTWLGLTATPHVNGPVGLADRFRWLVCGPSYRDLTHTPDPDVSARYGVPFGALTPLRYRVPGQGLTLSTEGIRVVAGEWDEAELAKRAEDERLIDAILRWALDEEVSAGLTIRRRVAFCVRVAHAKMVAARAEALGLRAAVVAGSDTDTTQGGVMRDRQAIFADLEAGRLDLVASCDALSRGWDSPSVTVGIMLRPWRRSLSAYVQQAGRLVRPCPPWKTQGLLLDAAGNVERWGTLEMQPLPSYDDLRSRQRTRSDAEPVPRMRRCPECGELCDVGLTLCMCGYSWADDDPTPQNGESVPHNFSGADPVFSLADRLTECERRRLWYASALRSAMLAERNPWEVDEQARAVFGVRDIRPEWRYQALYGGLPTPAEVQAYTAWIRRAALRRHPVWREKKSDGGWIADMLRREGL